MDENTRQSSRIIVTGGAGFIGANFIIITRLTDLLTMIFVFMKSIQKMLDANFSPM